MAERDELCENALRTEVLTITTQSIGAQRYSRVPVLSCELLDSVFGPRVTFSWYREEPLVNLKMFSFSKLLIISRYQYDSSGLGMA